MGEALDRKGKENDNFYERARQIREELFRKYGKFDDSTKIIREMRDEREEQHP